jgi:hypothetical protein
MRCWVNPNTLAVIQSFACEMGEKCQIMLKRHFSISGKDMYV